MIESVSEDRVRDLKFEVDLFLAKLQLINEKGTGQPSVDKKRIKENLHEFLRDDMIYFLQKLLSEHRTTFEKMMPGLVPSHREIIFQLKELQARVFYPVGKDFSKTSMIGRWLLALHARGHLSPHKVMNYFNIYKNRLYSLLEEKPFGFSDTETLVRRMLFSTDYEVSFDEIYSAEIELKREITFTLLRRVSTQSRIDYLVSKEVVEELSDNFIRILHRETAARLKQALAEMDELNKRILAEKKTVESEIKIAAKSQDKNLQKSLPADDPRIKFALWYDPLMSVGGDYYNVIRVSEHEYAIFLADISGHGIGAAMFFNTLRLAFEESLESADRPEKTMKLVNESVYGKLSDNFVTAIYVYVNLKKKIIKYCNAGHPKAFLFQKDGDRMRVRFLRQTGRVLGLFRKVSYKEKQIPLGGTARLIVYTDGITEAYGRENQMLGERGFLSMFRHTLTSGAEDAMESIRKDVLAFSGTEQREDDRSVILADIG
ncbi:MAG TPA: PP2C family protein-serine/threonine phosphatase [Leptospiraceae bacterium]|nr:serine/threonine-protein phosphatase [Leptospirales bacterium]HMU81733.1 PP2C family protein-serine/threonine phosphatase [Leptospiraceae bacterium]HMW59188.1 PP2C family protein-serine/threonine phosphatase [Leptospiraceae bacterium]HMX56336.1 PP2C family protein-serine/threonine phosphatase [Leptospiraceae bacterium]HMZ35366.1 PP2C family protein-serine/threonine phosphatase [Leptospiraceae bacterium]